MQVLPRFSQPFVSALKRGAVAVIPTDTMYGIVGSALMPETVETIYELRSRDKKKPLIVLIGDFNEIRRFGVRLESQSEKVLEKVWPGPTSVVLPASNDRWRHLHRGTRSIAFRLPRHRNLRRLLVKTGPLVAPSANLEGRPPAKTVQEAYAYFGERVPFYVDAGKKEGNPSTLIRIRRGEIAVLRK